MSARRRALRVLVAALVLAGASWFAAAMLGRTQFAFEADGGEAGLRVRTALPAGTCEKELTSAFPWFRLSCEPHEPTPRTLDSVPAGE